jgi:serine protease Do
VRLTVGVLLLVVGAALTARAGDQPADLGTSSLAVVYCYDSARQLVSHVLPSECRGKVISEAEARAIEEQRDRAVARAIATRPGAPPDGAHVVAIGSAFYVDEQGRLLTSKHVVDGCQAVAVRPAGKPPNPAVVLAVDAAQDLALLQVEEKSPGYVVFSSGPATAANGVVAIVGYPDEGLPPLQPIVTRGVLLKASQGDVPGSRLVLRINARHGNSGGPILDDRGLVVGIVYAKLDIPHVYAVTGRQAEETAVGVSVAPVLAFLSRTQTHYYLSKGGDELGVDRVLKLATTFVARAECWK